MERKPIYVPEMKKIELEILQHIDTVFKANQIEYFLDGGTLLGAIRHKGFIPWDDDIDIIVRRCNYKRALEALRNNSSRYKVLSRYDDPDYIYMFAKVVDSYTELREPEALPVRGLGVWVDIFPLECLPNDKDKRLAFQKKIYFYRNVASHSFRYLLGDKTRLKDRVLCWLCNLYGWKRALKRMETLCNQQSRKKTDYVANITSAPRMDYEVPAEAFDAAIDVVFEGNTFPAPIGYDAYLTALYGDYMQLPPLEKRVSNHVFEAYYHPQADN